MTNRKNLLFALLTLLFCAFTGGIPIASAQTQPQMPQPTVPQIFTLMGQYVRLAYNNEGFATLSYRTAQMTQDQNWVLLDVGITLMKDVPDYTIKRENFNLKTPDGTMVPLASKADFNKAGGLRNLVNIANRFRDSIDYFPPTVSKGCTLYFFSKPGAISYDQTELSWNRACVGRLFFELPGKVVPGQYWLYIDFAKSQVQVPFRILTKAEADEFSKSWEEIKKAHDEEYKQ